MTGEERLQKSQEILADLFQPGATEADVLTILTLTMAQAIRMITNSDQAFQMTCLKTFELMLRAPQFNPEGKN